ncbi:hypothetical protein M0812_11691 [Anaeramoeba flamelloides]|uniref:Uncharacterized protein n=1 Tax=Anaeramoeba flamelloides TaxID=1746091 RepID=A0AAV7ZX80_9EUKA|nr:hypothetical protein M0812_11691 [Anaeramoeba flamelloides]
MELEQPIPNNNQEIEELQSISTILKKLKTRISSLRNIPQGDLHSFGSIGIKTERTLFDKYCNDLSHILSNHTLLLRYQGGMSHHTKEYIGTLRKHFRELDKFWLNHPKAVKLKNEVGECFKMIERQNQTMSISHLSFSLHERVKLLQKISLDLHLEWDMTQSNEKVLITLANEQILLDLAIDYDGIVQSVTFNSILEEDENDNEKEKEIVKEEKKFEEGKERKKVNTNEMDIEIEIKKESNEKETEIEKETETEKEKEKEIEKETETENQFNNNVSIIEIINQELKQVLNDQKDPELKMFKFKFKKLITLYEIFGLKNGLELKSLLEKTYSKLCQLVSQDFAVITKRCEGTVLEFYKQMEGDQKKIIINEAILELDQFHPSLIGRSLTRATTTTINNKYQKIISSNILNQQNSSLAISNTSIITNTNNNINTNSLMNNNNNLTNVNNLVNKDEHRLELLSSYTLTLFFKPSFPITISQIQEILSKISTSFLREKPQKGNKKKRKKNEPNRLLEHILVPNLLKNGMQCFADCPEQKNSKIMFHLVGECHSGVFIQKIPLKKSENIVMVLNLIKQQLLFNELFLSCFKDLSKKNSNANLNFINRKKLNNNNNFNININENSQNDEQGKKDGGGGDDDKNKNGIEDNSVMKSSFFSVEICTEPPKFIEMSFLNLKNGIGTISVTIQIGYQEVEAVKFIDNQNKTEIGGAEQLLDILQKKRSIPHLFPLIFKIIDYNPSQQLKRRRRYINDLNVDKEIIFEK